MGTNRRYRSDLFDHTWRVVMDPAEGGTPILLFGSDSFDDAAAAYKVAVANAPERAIYLMQRARIVRRSPAD